MNGFTSTYPCSSNGNDELWCVQLFFFNAHLFFYPESSMSEVQLEVRGSQASSLGSGEIVRMASGILSSGHTPTPTWTEGTPSFTESSSSGELGKPLEMN